MKWILAWRPCFSDFNGRVASIVAVTLNLGTGMSFLGRIFFIAVGLLVFHSQSQSHSLQHSENIGESLVSQIDQKALQALDVLIAKNKGKVQEPDLLMRKGELFLKRARSARYFEMQREDSSDESLSFVPAQIREASARQYLKKSTQQFQDLVKRFPRFPLADQASYQIAFNHEQLGEVPTARVAYQKFLEQFPGSSLIPDAHMALGEIYYYQKNMPAALKHYESAQGYSKSRVAAYAEYKQAWVLYHLKDTAQAWLQIKKVIKRPNVHMSLQQEALKDSVLFFSETLTPQQAVTEYRSLELAPEFIFPALNQLGALYARHSRYSDFYTLNEQLLKTDFLSPFRVALYLQLVEVEMIQKQLLKARNALTQAQKLCLKDCPSQLKELDGKNITALWGEVKKKSSSELYQTLERVLKDKWENEKSPLLADFYFENGKFPLAANMYYELFKNQGDSSLLLAAIDSHARIDEGSPLEKKEPQKWLEEFVTKFPNHKNSDGFRIRLFGLYLQQKDLKKAEHIRTAIQKEDPSHRAPLAQQAWQDNELDYLNQKAQYQELSHLALKLAKQESRKERKTKLELISEQADTQQKWLAFQEIKDVKKAITFYQEFKAILSRAQHLSSEQKSDLWLDLYQQSFKQNFSPLDQSILTDFIEQFPQHKSIKELAQTQWSRALGRGDLRAVTQIGLMLIPYSSAKERPTFLKTSLLAAQHLGEVNLWKNIFENHDSHLSSQEKEDWLFSLMDSSDKWPEQLPIMKWAQQYELDQVQNYLELTKWHNSLNKKNGEAAFAISKKYYQNHYPRRIRQLARSLQAKVFANEFYQLPAKAQKDRASLVLSLKMERFEKLQKALEDVIDLTPAEHPDLKIYQSQLQEALDHFVTYVEKIAHTHKLSDWLALLPSLKEQANSYSSLSNTLAYDPLLYQNWHQIFPKFDVKNGSSLKALGAFEQAELALEKGQWERAAFLNQIAESLDSPAPVEFQYQKARIFLGKNQIKEALDRLSSLKHKEFQSKNEATLQLLKGYISQNYYRCLGFANEEKTQISKNQDPTGSLALIKSECALQTQQWDLADQYLKLASDKTLGYWLQKARIQEKKSAPSEMIYQAYQKALDLSPDEAKKRWIEGRLKAQSSQESKASADKKVSQEQSGSM